MLRILPIIAALLLTGCIDLTGPKYDCHTVTVPLSVTTKDTTTGPLIITVTATQTKRVCTRR